MKKLLTITIAVLLFAAIGCQQENSIVSPENALSSQHNNPPGILAKGDKIYSVDVKSLSFNSTINLLKISKTVTLDGTKGGKFSFTYLFNDGSTVDAILTLDKGSYDGKKTFNITFDAYNKTVDLDPHGTIFTIPAYLTLKYKGLDFDNDVLTKGIDWTNATSAQFVYFPENGLPEVVNCAKVEVSPVDGQLYVVDARLPHFSRFGFIR